MCGRESITVSHLPKIPTVQTLVYTTHSEDVCPLFGYEYLSKHLFSRGGHQHLMLPFGIVAASCRHYFSVHFLNKPN